MNNYSRIMVAKSLQNYSRVFRMYMLDSHGRTLNGMDERNLLNVS